MPRDSGTAVKAASIPIVSLAATRSGQADRLIGEVRRACEQIGFFIIVDHGVSRQLIREMYDVSGAFFCQSPAVKAAIPESGDVLGGLMHYGLETESLAAGRGDSTPPDLKETLDYGPGFYGVTWPDSPADLQTVWSCYYESMSVLARQLRRIFAAAIGLNSDYFEGMFGQHHSSLRVLNYPMQDSAPQRGQLRAGAHTDYGFLTILRSEASPGGLQAQQRSGSWIDVPAVDGGFVVNIGDAMMRWTNDVWISTPHRVINPPAAADRSPRRSIAFFHNPNRDAVIECLDAFCSDENPAKYPPITYHEYAQQKYRQTHGTDLK